MFEIRVREQFIPRKEVVEDLLRLANLDILARELIAERVRMEYDRPDISGGEIRLFRTRTETEKTLNDGAKNVSVETEIDRALNSFASNGFILLVDDHQIENLDSPVPLTPDSVVTFLRLTPLKGG